MHNFMTHFLIHQCSVFSSASSSIKSSIQAMQHQSLAYNEIINLTKNNYCYTYTYKFDCDSKYLVRRGDRQHNDKEH